MGLPDIPAGDSLDKQTYAERAYQEIKRRILRLELPPGGYFTESALAADLGLSKTPVRSALARLQLEGMAEVTARSGYRVAPVTLRDARDLCALRTLLEGEAAALAATNLQQPDELRRLEELCRADYAPDDIDSVADFLVKNTRFHTTIAHIGGNARLAKALGDTLEQLERLFHLGLRLSARTMEIVHEHTDLVQAIVSGDAAGARELAVAQSQSSQKMILEALLSSDVLTSTNIAPASLPQPRHSRRPSGQRGASEHG